MLKFFSLCNKFFYLIEEQKIPMQKLLRYLKVLKAFEEPTKSESSVDKDVLEKSDDIEDIKDVIETYSSFCL